MKAKSIYVNLPSRDLKKSRAFWTALGFSFNEQFSDEKALCLVLYEGAIYVMLLSHAMFSSFTNRKIADQSTTQVLNALEVESREQVDEMVKKAIENGGSRYRNLQDHGWMYGDSFADPDGHQWEVLYINTTQIPK